MHIYIIIRATYHNLLQLRLVDTAEASIHHEHLAAGQKINQCIELRAVANTLLNL